MKNIDCRTRLIGRAGLVALLAAPSLGAQDRWEWEDRDRSDGRGARDARQPVEMRRRDEERRLFTWRGSVDDETRIVMRAGRVESQVISGRNGRGRDRVDRDRPLPRRAGRVRVQLLDGRGRVHVIQQPSASNNYTTIVRVKDAQSGADSYRFAAFFDPADDWDGGRVWSDSDGGVYSGSRVFRWSGSVDGDLRITLRRGSVGYNVVFGEAPQGVSTTGGSQMPRRDGQLGVSLRQGRGAVTILQQPNSYNNYTAIIRVLDRPSGYGHYDFELVWR